MAMKPNQVTDALCAYVDAYINGVRPAPIAILGPPGVGKSQIGAQVIEKYHLYFRPAQEIRLGDRDPIGLMGVPLPGTDENQPTMWPRPDFFPPEILPDGYDFSVMMMEEIDKAPPAMRNLGLQLLLDRRLGKWQLPDHCIILVFGNDAASRSGSTGGKNWAFQNRMIWLNMVPDLEDTLAWQQANEIHPYIGAFLQYMPEAHHNLDVKSKDDNFASPRSWAEVDNVLRMATTADIRRQMFVGTVGPVGVAFSAFLKKAECLPDLDDVYSDPMGAPLVDEADAKWLICGAVANRAEPVTMREACQYIGRYTNEWAANFCRAISRREDSKTFDKVKEFVDLRLKIADLLLDIS